METAITPPQPPQAPQLDLKSLMQASPGLQMLPPEQFQTLLASVDTLPPAAQEQIRIALTEEQQKLTAIKTEYDEKKHVLFNQYMTEMKDEEVKMAKSLREGMESQEREKEVKIMEGLMAELEKL